MVKTVMASPSIGKSTRAPSERPIQLRCCSLIASGQSSASRSSSSRSAYAVMRMFHWRSLALKTGKFPRSERPSAVTSSLASTVPSPGDQLTGASEAYASRYSLRTSARSVAVSSFHARVAPSTLGTARSPLSNWAISTEIGRALSASSSYQELKICRKIHWVHL